MSLPPQLRLRLRTTETSLKAEAIGNEQSSRQVGVLSETVAEYESRIIDLETALGQATNQGLRLTTKSDRTSKELIAMVECEEAVSSTNQVLMEMNAELEQRLVDLAERYKSLDFENDQNMGLAQQGPVTSTWVWTIFHTFLSVMPPHARRTVCPT